MSGGTFIVSRSIWDHPEFAPSEFSEREAFLWMVSEAAWKPCRVRAGRVVVDLERGQFCHSIRFMADVWGWSKDKVSRFFKRLKTRDTIATDTATGQLVVTICNYDEFQLMPSDGATEARRDPQRSRDTTATDKNSTNSTNSKTLSGSKANRFQEFWDAFPHRGGAKKGRKKATEKYARAIASGVSEQTIITAAIAYREDAQVRRGYGSGPVVWLNGEMWNDEIERDHHRPARANHPRTGGAHDSLMAGFSAFADRPDEGAGGCGGGETAFHPGDEAMDFGAGGDGPEPVFRIVGSS